MARRRGRSTPIYRKTKATKPRNRAAQDATLINIRSLKRAVAKLKKDLQQERTDRQAELLRTTLRIDQLILAGQKLERMIFPAGDAKSAERALASEDEKSK